MVRKIRRVETRMVAEYLQERYQAFQVMVGVPLGAIPPELVAQYGVEKAIRRYRPWRPEVDAVVILPRYLLLIEAKVWSVIDGLAKLPLYKALIPNTPELRPYRDREVLMQLVVGQTNANLETMAMAAGVEVQVFNPPWLQEEIKQQDKYWTQEYRAERERILELRQRFGVE